jgi:starvation-inducible outer membrane lipoprotein
MLSSRVRQQADPTIPFAQLHAQPEACIGRTVILGGEIVRVWNVPGATWFDVAHHPLHPEDQPMLMERSAGH